MSALIHAIPGGGIISAYQIAKSDEPFLIKARGVAIGSASSSFHFLVGTHHASKILAANPTGYKGTAKGWGSVRALATNPYIATTAAVIGIYTAGYIVSDLIDSDQGTQNYVEFLTQPTKMVKRLKWSLGTIAQHYLS